jgi:hypothetical protein
VDPQIAAALITVAGGGVLTGVGFLVRRRLKARDDATTRRAEESEQSATRLHEVVSAVLLAGSRSVAALDDDGDMGAARHEADDRLQEAVATLHAVGDARAGGAADRLVAAVRDRDRSGAEAAMNALRARLRG